MTAQITFDPKALPGLRETLIKKATKYAELAISLEALTPLEFVEDLTPREVTHQEYHPVQLGHYDTLEQFIREVSEFPLEGWKVEGENCYDCPGVTSIVRDVLRLETPQEVQYRVCRERMAHAIKERQRVGKERERIEATMSNIRRQMTSITETIKGLEEATQ